MLDPQIVNEYNATRTISNTSVLCHAPFTSMNFEQTGKVTVCCYNRIQLLGKYPEQPLQEMWFGSQAQQFRQSFKGQQLPYGCESCASQLLSHNFGNYKAQFYDKLASPAYPSEGFDLWPKVMEFEISNVCNLECTMCNGMFSSAIRKNREKLPKLHIPYDDAFVHQLEAFIPHLEEAKFLGGEPFMVKSYYQIWELIIQHNPEVEISITTNGTIMNQRVRDILEKLNASIIVSVDSLEKDTYEQIRINAKMEQLLENIEYFKAYTQRKKTRLFFAVCPMQQNWKEIPKLVQYCNKHNITIYFNSVYSPLDHSLRILSNGKLRDIISYYKSFHFTTLHASNIQKFGDLINHLEHWLEEGIQGDISNSVIKDSYYQKLSLFEQIYQPNNGTTEYLSFLVKELLKGIAQLKGPLSGSEEKEDNAKINFTINKDLIYAFLVEMQKKPTAAFMQAFFQAYSVITDILQHSGQMDDASQVKHKIEFISSVVLSHPSKYKIFEDMFYSHPVKFLLNLNTYTSEQIEMALVNAYGPLPSAGG